MYKTKAALSKVILALYIVTLIIVGKFTQKHFQGHHIKATADIEDEEQIEKSSFNSSTNITIVTAYFDIGSFPKGSYSKWYHKEMYFEWVNVFRFIQNNVVVFTDSEKFRTKMLSIRQNLLNKTKVLMVNRTNAWPFENLKRVQDVFNSKGYPKFLPNTVYPLYACVQHAKYYVLQIALEKDYFRTKYFMWLDIGLFRKRLSMAPFYMSKPKGFDETKIAMTQVYPEKDFNKSPERIIKTNDVIVCGALAFGERQQMLKFSKQFKKAVHYFLQQNMTNTDQQIIYAMFSEKGQQVLKPEVQLQMYKSNKRKDWFYLGYYMVMETQN